MAQDTIPSWYTTMYRANVHRVASQTKSRLEWLTEPIPNEKAETGFYDSIGTVKSRRVATKFAQVQYADVNHTRRKLTKEEFAIEIPIAERDLESVLTDPKSMYITRAIEEMNRRKDRVILEAMFADVFTGQTGATQITAATDGVLTVNATGGFTYAKVNEINQNFIDNEVGNEMPIRKALGITGAEHTAIMGINQFISGDYTRGKPVDDGAIQQISGLDLIRYGNNVDDPIMPAVGGVRTSFAAAQGSVAIWYSRTPDIEVEKRTDLIKTWHIIVTMVVAAVRTEGALLQKVTFTG